MNILRGSMISRMEIIPTSYGPQGHGMVQGYEEMFMRIDEVYECYFHGGKIL
jgi:hypothetical protein